jgi:hypothetical protein
MHLPKTMVPAPGTARILQEPQSIPVYSSSIQAGLRRNRPERNPEHGSSIPIGIFPYRKRSTSDSFPLLVSKGNLPISHRKPIRNTSYRPGTNTEYHRIPYKNYLQRFIAYFHPISHPKIAKLRDLILI